MCCTPFACAIDWLLDAASPSGILHTYYYHSQCARNLLGALSSSYFQGTGNENGEDKIDAEVSAMCASHHEGSTPTILDVELPGF